VTIEPILSRPTAGLPAALADVLRPGMTVDARVVAGAAAGTLRLSLTAGLIDVLFPAGRAPPPAGTPLRLAVAAAEDGSLQLHVVPRASASVTPAAGVAPQLLAAPAAAAAVPLPGATGVAGGMLVAPAAPVVPPAAVATGAGTQIVADGSAPPPPARPGASPPAAVAAALTAAVGEAATRQSGFAPLFTTLAQLPAVPGGLPPDVQRAVSALLGLRLDAARPPAAATLKRAFAGSGLMREANLFAASPSGEAAPDLKGALVALRRALAAWVGGDVAPKAVPAAADPARADPTKDAMRAATRDEPSDAPPPPPPRRGVPPVAERPALPLLAADAPALEVARLALHQTDGALARVVLSQFASLPDGQLQQANAQWTFQLPVALPNGTAVAGFQVERDTAGGGAEGAERGWRVRFAVDAGDGGVEALVGLVREDVSVNLRAENPATLERLGDELPLLRAALEAAGLVVTDLRLAGGHLRETPPAHAAALVDRLL
jgi:hypothetical protein